MGPLFWRIFLGLWLGSAALMVGTSALIALSAEKTLPDVIRERVEKLLHATAHSTLALRDHIPPDRFAARLESLQREDGVALYVIDESGRELLDRPLPPGLLQLDPLKAGPHGRVQMGSRAIADLLTFADIWTDAAGRRYRVLMTFDGQPRPPVAYLLQRLIGPLLLSVLLAGMISALATRYLVEPIMRLQAATRRLAAGELDHRVGHALSARHDEFTVLARDFDRMADQISNLLGAQRRLMQDLSHELRSPLARLRVALELLRGPSPRADLLDRIERDADRMDVLIGELLLLARLDSPEMPARHEDVDLDELIGEIVDDARLEGAASHRELHYRQHASGVHASGVQVTGDRELLHRAIENVVRNALQHTPEGAEIVVTLTHRPDEAEIRIADSGPGVATELLERLFTPFVRGEAAGKEGNGLGLAIARGAVQLHGGDIAARPRDQGTGLEVTIRLPLARAASN